MRKVLTYSIAAVLALSVCVGTAILMHLEKTHRTELACTGLQVEFKDSLRFVSQEDVENYLKRNYGAYIGQMLDSVRLDRMENMLDAQSAILKSEAWATDDGVLHISITQRKPAVRFEKGEVGFYADDRGFIFPLHENFTAGVPVVKGALPLSEGNAYKGPAKNEKEQEWIEDILQMTAAFNSSKAWKGRISEYEVRPDGDVVVKPADRPECFIIGEPVNIREKIAMIEKYFTHILPSAGEVQYKSVNVKYNGQIICRKDI